METIKERMDELLNTVDDTCTHCTSHQKKCTNTDCALYQGVVKLNEQIKEYYSD